MHTILCLFIYILFSGAVWQYSTLFQSLLPHHPHPGSFYCCVLSGDCCCWSPKRFILSRSFFPSRWAVWAFHHSVLGELIQIYRDWPSDAHKAYFEFSVKPKLTLPTSFILLFSLVLLHGAQLCFLGMFSSTCFGFISTYHTLESLRYLDGWPRGRLTGSKFRV